MSKAKRRSRSLFDRKHPLKTLLLSLTLSFIFAVVFWFQPPADKSKRIEASKLTELYANQVNDDLTLIFSRAIQRAEKSVFLIVYTLTDPTIIATLEKKSKQGIPVRVICDAIATPSTHAIMGTKVMTLRRFGAGHMHQKILVIDEKETIIGSSNMTTESLRLYGNLAASIESPEIAERVLIKANTLNVEGQKITPFPHSEFILGEQKIELSFLPDDLRAVNRLKKLIESAKKTIKIAMFTWTRKDLAEAVIAASKRGVNVEIVIDRKAGKGCGAKIVKMLKQGGIPVALSRPGPLLHHKFLYIDSSILVHGSANWTWAAFTKNDDCFIIMHALTPAQKQKMEALWNVVYNEAEPVGSN